MPFPVFTLELHLLSSGLEQGRETNRATIKLSAGREERGGISRSSSLISHLTKASDEDNKHSPALSLSFALSHLSLALLCLTVRVLVEHGSSDTFHISSPFVVCALTCVCVSGCILACVSAMFVLPILAPCAST